MTLVIDASVALKWVLDEEGSDAAAGLRSEMMIAPSLWPLEAANALWRRARLGHITAAEAKERLAELMNAPVAAVPIEDLLVTATDLALTLGHPVHDCLYLALALREDAVLVTADSRFVAAVASDPLLAPRVRRL